jgi:hypothetical protein
MPPIDIALPRIVLFVETRPLTVCSGVWQVLVYATRGTDEVFDLFQDLDGWCEALVIQTASYLFPLYGSPIFQPMMKNFVGSTHHLVQALSSMKLRIPQARLRSSVFHC